MDCLSSMDCLNPYINPYDKLMELIYGYGYAERKARERRLKNTITEHHTKIAMNFQVEFKNSTVCNKNCLNCPRRVT